MHIHLTICILNTDFGKIQLSRTFRNVSRGVSVSYSVIRVLKRMAVMSATTDIWAVTTLGSMQRTISGDLYRARTVKT
jgi:hypothetical protein